MRGEIGQHRGEPLVDTRWTLAERSSLEEPERGLLLASSSSIQTTDFQHRPSIYYGVAGVYFGAGKGF